MAASTAVRWATFLVLSAAVAGKTVTAMRSTVDLDVLPLVFAGIEVPVAVALLIKRWGRFGAAGASLIGVGGVAHALFFNRGGCRCFGAIATLDRGAELIVASLLASAGFWLLSNPSATDAPSGA